MLSSQPLNYRLRSEAREGEIVETQPTATETTHNSTGENTEQETEITGPRTIGTEIHTQTEMAKVNSLLATSLLQPMPYDGTAKPLEWTNQFKRWVKLQNLNDEEAGHAISFYFTGPARTWYDGLPPSEQNNIQSILRLMEVRFASSGDEEDILTAQRQSESVKEYFDRVFLKAKIQKTPDSFLCTIIKRGLRPEFETYIIQSEAKTLEDIQRAAITAEKCINKTKRLGVNAISHSDIEGLQNSMKLMMQKVEELKEENKSLKQNFDKPIPHYQKNNFRPSFKQNSNQYNQFGQNRNAKTQQDNGCTKCGSVRCSGEFNKCWARDKVCAKCKKIGHYARVCHSATGKYGNYINH